MGGHLPSEKKGKKSMAKKPMTKKPAPKKSPPKKGSNAMKEKMKNLRAMKK